MNKNKLYVLVGFLFISTLVQSNGYAQIIITNPYVKASPSLQMSIPQFTPQAEKPAPRRQTGTIEIAPPKQFYKSPNGNHLQWCHNQYKTYRERDNSFIPYGGGVRHSCSSPFQP